MTAFAIILILIFIPIILLVLLRKKIFRTKKNLILYFALLTLECFLAFFILRLFDDFIELHFSHFFTEMLGILFLYLTLIFPILTIAYLIYLIFNFILKLLDKGNKDG